MNRRLPRPALILALALAPFAGAADTPAKKIPVDFPVDTKPIERATTGGRLASYADVIEKTTPAVVSITTAQVIRQMPRGRGDMNDLLRRMLEGGSPQLDEQESPQQNARGAKRTVPLGLGSGTLISADGFILTNRHVISKPDGSQADEITVTLQDKREFTAKVIGADARTDIALIKIEGKNLPVAKMTDSNALRVGDVVFAVGNPLGVGMTVTSGIVSALGRDNLGLLGRRGGIESFIQTDASINPGNSGGPLIDAEGRIIGVNTAIVSGNGGNIGIGFAVPTAIARDIVTSLANDGKLSRGYFGLSAQDIDRPTAEALNLPNQRGALVSNVGEDTPAAKAGIRDGDIIKLVDGHAVDSWSGLQSTIARLKPGIDAKVELLREGKTETIVVKVGDRDAAEAVEAAGMPLSGVKLATITDEARKRFGIPDGVKGVVVTAMDGDSPFTGRLLPGVVITELNRRAVSAPKQIADGLVKGRANAMKLYYNGGYSYLVVRP